MQLACFQPNNEKPETLEEILRARADPNLIVGDDVSPLRKVTTFARNHDVARMRELLLAYGASESAFERQRWAERPQTPVMQRGLKTITGQRTNRTMRPI